ncbi:MAG TPA: DUF2382 domain-containing protein [Leptolyngbyaceae cyanobacterium]
MALVKIKDFYPDHQDTSTDYNDIKHYDVYAQDNDKVGSVHDILVDEVEGRIRYLIVDTGFWVFGKKVLLPIGLARIDYSNKRVVASSLTKEQVENLPNVDDKLQKIDEEHEEQVQGVYSSDKTRSATTAASATTSDLTSSRYDRNPNLYNMSDSAHQNLKLYEERLVANKKRQKTGEVSIGKHVETETARVAVPLEKERVVIERTPGNQQSVDPTTADFKDGVVERIEVYEETPDIHKEAFVREEVQVRKEVEQDVALSREKVRREELDVDTQGRPSVEK